MTSFGSNCHGKTNGIVELAYFAYRGIVLQQPKRFMERLDEARLRGLVDAREGAHSDQRRPGLRCGPTRPSASPVLSGEIKAVARAPAAGGTLSAGQRTGTQVAKHIVFGELQSNAGQCQHRWCAGWLMQHPTFGMTAEQLHSTAVDVYQQVFLQ